MKILFYTCNFEDDFSLSYISMSLEQTRSDEDCGGDMTGLKPNMPLGNYWLLIT